MSGAHSYIWALLHFTQNSFFPFSLLLVAHCGGRAEAEQHCDCFLMSSLFDAKSGGYYHSHWIIFPLPLAYLVANAPKLCNGAMGKINVPPFLTHGVFSIQQNNLHELYFPTTELKTIIYLFKLFINTKMMSEFEWHKASFCRLII